MKIIKRLLIVFLMVGVLLITGCKKKKQKSYQMGKLTPWEFYNFADELNGAFYAHKLFYAEEETFATDPNDSNYEIGYAFESDYEYKARIKEDFEPSIFTQTSIYHKKVRRNKSTKELDTNYYDIYDSSEKTFEIQTVDEGRLVNAVYYISADNIKTVTLTEEDYFNLFPFKFRMLDRKEMKREDTDNILKDKWTIKTKEYGTLEFIGYDGMTSNLDYLIVMPNDEKLFVLGMLTDIYFDYH